MRTSGKTKSHPDKPNLHRADSGEVKKHIKKGAIIELWGFSSLLHLFGLAHPHILRLYSPLLPNKTEL